MFAYILNSKERNWREFYQMGTPAIFTTMPRLKKRLIHSCSDVIEHLDILGIVNIINLI